MNTAFCKAYRCKLEEVIGKDSVIFWIQQSQSPNTRSAFRIGRKAWQVGFYHRRKNGSIFPVSLTRSIVKDSNRKEIAVVSVVRDISDNILMDGELRTANLELKTHEQQLVPQSQNKQSNSLALLPNHLLHRHRFGQTMPALCGSFCGQFVCTASISD